MQVNVILLGIFPENQKKVKRKIRPIFGNVGLLLWKIKGFTFRFRIILLEFNCFWLQIKRLDYLNGYGSYCLCSQKADLIKANNIFFQFLRFLTKNRKTDILIFLSSLNLVLLYHLTSFYKKLRNESWKVEKLNFDLPQL